jgi:hypothetical protein
MDVSVAGTNEPLSQRQVGEEHQMRTGRTETYAD